jgi:general secretion pathway protein G
MVGKSAIHTIRKEIHIDKNVLGGSKRFKFYAVPLVAMGDFIMKTVREKAFTLVEILIVMVILGILAAIVIPQFTQASQEARLSELINNLQMIRTQIELYKIQHSGQLPGTAAEMNFVSAMTDYTFADGTPSVAGTPRTFGKYLQRVPKNPFTMSNDVEVSGQEPQFGTSAWFFNTTTGEFRANDSATHAVY